MRIIIDLAFTDSPDSFKDDPDYAETLRLSQLANANHLISEIKSVIEKEITDNPDNTDLVDAEVYLESPTPS